MKNVDRLIELFDDESVSWDAARAVGRIPGEDKVLTKRNHAIIKVRYDCGGRAWFTDGQSRFFTHRSTRTLSFLGSLKARRHHVRRLPMQKWDVLIDQLAESSRQNAYLVALAALIKSVPKSTYTHQMPAVSIVPLSDVDSHY